MNEQASQSGNPPGAVVFGVGEDLRTVVSLPGASHHLIFGGASAGRSGVGPGGFVGDGAPR